MEESPIVWSPPPLVARVSSGDGSRQSARCEGVFTAGVKFRNQHLYGCPLPNFVPRHGRLPHLFAHRLRFPASPWERQHATPQALRPPDPRAQTFKLDDLAVIDEQVHVWPVVLDIPGEDL